MTETGRSRLVKAPQTRDGHGVSAVYVEPAGDWDAPGEQVYVKRQRHYYCRPAWRLFRRTPTLRRELRGLDACRKLGIGVPVVVSYRESGPDAELVLEEVRGTRPLAQALEQFDADRNTILGNLAEVIGRLHRAGWAHGALYSDHVLIGPPPEHAVALIDLEKARRSRRRRRSDLERLIRHVGDQLSNEELTTFLTRYRRALAGSAPPAD